MELEKSKGSSIALSCVTVLSFAATSAILDLLLPYLITGKASSVVEYPEKLANLGDALVLAGLIAFLLLALIGIFAYFLYRFFGESYYGRRGGNRWALFGALFAVFFSAPQWLLPARFGLFITIWQILSFFLAFFLARKIIPLERKTA